MISHEDKIIYFIGMKMYSLFSTTKPNIIFINSKKKEKMYYLFVDLMETFQFFFFFYILVYLSHRGYMFLILVKLNFDDILAGC